MNAQEMTIAVKKAIEGCGLGVVINKQRLQAALNDVLPSYTWKSERRALLSVFEIDEWSLIRDLANKSPTDAEEIINLIKTKLEEELGWRRERSELIIGCYTEAMKTNSDSSDKVYSVEENALIDNNEVLKKESNENTNLAEYYFFGQKDFPQDYFLAFKYALKGAQGGNSNAQFRVAYMYEMGLGTKPDISEAHRWYVLATGYYSGL